MKGNKLFFSVLIMWISCISTATGQMGMLKSNISIENQSLVAKIDNPIRIVAQQKEPVSIEQLNGTLHVSKSLKLPIEITERNGYFYIRPDTIGLVEINITIGDTTETMHLRAKPLEAVGRLGGRSANTEEKFGPEEFKTQRGIIANVECCGFDARCTVLEFHVIRINKRNQVERAINKGGTFEEQTWKITTKAESGDIFIFRQIRYRCHKSGSPQRLDDMIFEIK